MYYYDSLNKLSPICLRLNTFVFPHILIRTPSWPAAKNTYFICCCFFNLMGNFIENVPFIFSYIIKRFGKRHDEGEITASSRGPAFTEEFKRHEH